MLHPITIYRHEGDVYSHGLGHNEALGSEIMSPRARFVTQRTKAFLHYVSQAEGERSAQLQETMRGLYRGIII